MLLMVQIMFWFLIEQRRTNVVIADETAVTERLFITLRDEFSFQSGSLNCFNL